MLPDRGCPGRVIRSWPRWRGSSTATSTTPARPDGPDRPRSVFFLGARDSPARPHETVVGRVAGDRSAGRRARPSHAHARRARGGARQRDHRDHDRAVVPAAAGHLASSSTSAATTPAARASTASRWPSRSRCSASPVVRFTAAPSRPAHAGVGASCRTSPRTDRRQPVTRRRGAHRAARRDGARAAAAGDRLAVRGRPPDPGRGGGERLAATCGRCRARPARDHRHRSS